MEIEIEAEQLVKVGENVEVEMDVEVVEVNNGVESGQILQVG